MSKADSVYADYQATTPVDPRVVEAMTPFWHESFGNPHSNNHARGWHAQQTVQEAASSVAELIGAEADEVIFTSGATEANNLALIGSTRHVRPGRNRILVSAIEHKCVLAAASFVAEREGFAVDKIAVDSEGLIDLDVLREQLNDDILLVSIMAVNNEIGTVQQVAEIGSVLEAYNIPFHCDAAQAPCAMEMRNIASHADLISLSSHKIYGPQGIGALFVRRALQERLEPLIHGGGQQNGLRSGTIPLPLSAGFGTAAKLLSEVSSREERHRIAGQRNRFVELIQSGASSVTENGPVTAHRHPGNANLRFNGFDAQDILGVLQPRLAASTGAACTSGTPEPSHVLRAIGLSAVDCDASIRFSFGRFTSDEEIDLAAEEVISALKTLSDSFRTLA